MLVFVHGGSWIYEDKDYWSTLTGLYGSIGIALAKRGIVTVVTNYRLAPEVDIDGILDDVVASLRWTIAHAAEHGGDARRVVLMGHSAGAHLVAMLGTDEAQLGKRGMDAAVVAGVVAISTVWDVKAMHEELGPAQNEKVVYRVFGRDPARWAAYSPLGLMHAGGKPFFVAVGGDDYPFMIPGAERARDHAKELGNEVQYLLVPERSHRGMVLTFGASDDAMSEPVTEFVRRVSASPK